MSEKSKFFWNNQNLFSNNYLEYRLPAISLWKEQREKANEVFKEIKAVYETIKDLKLGPGQESELEDKFIRPVLGVLGFAYNVQPVTKRGFKKRRPDYALFRDSDSYREANRYKDNPEKFFSYSLSILEAKYWGRRLNDTDKNDILDSRDPTAQTVKYLDDVHYHTAGKINWAILTNGKHWRLFYYRAASRSGNFFEVDLEEILKRDRLDDFLYFYLFFSRDAFIPDPVTGKLWLDWHLEGSESYAKAVSNRLKDLIFDKVFEGLAAGLIHYRKTELSIKGETEASRKEVFKGCLTLLYRLLFLLYAESRNLLPLDEDGYRSVSLSRLKEDIYKDLMSLGADKISKRSYVYWARLEGLCNIIAEGDPALNVPVYNGGLFETSDDSFLVIHKMPDYFFAGAIELLTIDHDDEYPPGIIPFIDYSSLSVRHLGDIYEGLLEFHLQIAEEEIVEVKEKSKSVWKKTSEIKEGTRTYRRKRKGEIYIENSKHERKATGSYYTPHYIVEYIVKNTVSTVLEERLKKAKEVLSELERLYQKQRRQLKKPKDWKHWEHPGEPKGKYIEEILQKEKEVFETIFDIKILDPAMGSGHFLVHTVDFISDRIISFLADYPENPVIRRIHGLRDEILGEIRRQGVRIDESKLTEVNLIKRMVMKRCIYGVDLNDMAVELAKLSLWLDSFTLGAPLSFLDHHLKCGNSLIGILDISDVIIPGSEAYAKVQRALSFMLQISELTDSTISEAKKSYDLFKHAQKEIGPIRRRFDVATAKHFINLGAKLGRLEHLAYTLDFDKEPYPEVVEKCKNALHFARDKYFFHWRLEFPEVFYTEKGEKANSGFDCVIGNPPWGANLTKEEKEFCKLLETDTSTPNSYIYIIRRSELILKKKGFGGFIIPDSILIKDYALTRCNLLFNNTLQQVIYLERVFKDVNHDSALIIFQKEMQKNYNLLIGIVPHDEISIELYLTPLQGSYFKNEELEFRFNLNLNSKNANLYHRLSKMPKVGDIGEFHEGIHTGNIREKLFFKSNPNYHDTSKIKPCLIGSIYGDEFERYYYISNDNWTIYDPSFIKKENGEYASLRDENIFIGPKLYVTRTGDDFYCFYDENHYASNNLFSFKFNPEITKLSYLFTMTILNSNFAQKYNRLFLAPRFGKLFTETKIIHLKLLPIPPISFRTSLNIRKKAVNKAINLYNHFNFKGVLRWTEHALSENRNDTIHDFLAFLAEQMIKLNKEKNWEIKGFLKWLEREIGTEIESLQNKTAIKEYHDYDFNKLLEVLKKNRKNISIDPSDRKTQERLEKEYTKCITALTPLKERIKKTDELIDKIVYRLYGLTDEEIEIVEGENANS